LALLLGCGSNTSSQETVDGDLESGGLPGVAGLDGLRERKLGPASQSTGQARSTSFFGNAWLEQWAEVERMLSASQQTVVEDDTVTIVANASTPLGFAVFPIPITTDQQILQANLISDDGSALISENGAGLISEGSAGLIGSDGASVIGQNGANLVGNAGNTMRSYALANFEDKTWEFADSNDTGLIDLGDLPGEPADYRSPDGFAYLSPLVFGQVNAELPQRKAVILGFTGLPCDPTDSTPAPELTGFTVEPVSSGAHVSWDDLGATNPYLVKVYFSNQPFESVDEEGVVPMTFWARQREGLISLNAGGVFYLRALVLNTTSCKESALTETQIVIPKSGTPLKIEVDVDNLNATLAESVTLTATGAETYDWDLNDDGIYEISGDTGGVQVAPNPAQVGPQYVRVLGRAGANGVALRTVPILRRGWITGKILENGGNRLSMTKLPDGRPGIIYYANDLGGMTYAYPSDLKGLGTWNKQLLKADEWAVYGVTDSKIVTANGAPAVMLRGNIPAGARLEVLSTDSPLGSSGWVSSLVGEGEPAPGYRFYAYGPDILGNE
ncbi:MAG: hypothetical protein M3R04_00990, partial [bacterium]|nr:hypothetical protein [bacterium]